MPMQVAMSSGAWAANADGGGSDFESQGFDPTLDFNGCADCGSSSSGFSSEDALTETELADFEDLHHQHEQPTTPTERSTSQRSLHHRHRRKGLPTMRQIERGHFFQSCVSIMILLSAMASFCQAQRALVQRETWEYINTVFLLFFFCELIFRITAHGRDFFLSNECDVDSLTGREELFWNYFDLTIVIIGLLHEATKYQSDHGTVVFIFRTLRLFRVFRAVRILKSFPELYILMRGLVQSMSKVMWLAVMFGIFITLCSIALTQFIGQEAEEFSDPQVIRDYFGTVPQSMCTLFVFLTCDDWSTTARMVNERYPGMEIFWVFYLFLCAFTLLSVLTGVMIDEMEKAREKHHEMLDAVQARRLHSLQKRLRRVFAKSDANADLKIDKEEFRTLLEDKAMQAELHECGITDLLPEEAEDLFVVLFEQSEEAVDFDRFFDGLMPLTHFRRKARTKQLMLLDGQIAKLDRRLASYEPEREHVDRLSTRALNASERVRKLDESLQAVFRQAGFHSQPQPLPGLQQLAAAARSSLGALA